MVVYNINTPRRHRG